MNVHDESFVYLYTLECKIKLETSLDDHMFIFKACFILRSMCIRLFFTFNNVLVKCMFCGYLVWFTNELLVRRVNETAQKNRKKLYGEKIIVRENELVFRADKLKSFPRARFITTGKTASEFLKFFFFTLRFWAHLFWAHFYSKKKKKLICLR